MTIINRDMDFIYLKSRKTASSSVEIFLITHTVLGTDIYSTSREILDLGFPRAKRNQPAFPGFSRGWYTPGRVERTIKSRVRGSSRLHPAVKQHDSAKRVRQILGSRKFDKATVAVNVRNPWDAIVSFYRWELTGGLGRWRAKSLPWDTWLREKLTPRTEFGGLSEAQKWLFHDFLFIGQHFIRPYLVRFEDIDTSLRGLATATGVLIPSFAKSKLFFKRDTKGMSMGYREFYSAEQADLVRRRFCEYLELTNYQF